MMEADYPALVSPVRPDEDARAPQEGVALCLSGGGYRAMLFHVGALWRLNELAWLSRLQRISSVSGGSITAGTLGLHWSELQFDAGGVAGDLHTQLVQPVRKLAGKTIDLWAVIGGILTPGMPISAMVAAAYRKHIFGRATLQQLPDEPRFVLNATNLQTGVLWRFSKPYMADYTIGLVPCPHLELARAVAASSAFPPVLSPLRLKLDPDKFEAANRGPNYRRPYNATAVLSDGGVYDNLGLETAWKRYTTVLVSDGGGHMQAAPRVHGDWIRQAIRVNSVIDNQVRDLRKREVIAGFQRNEKTGAYWGIRSDIADFGPPPGSLPCPHAQTEILAATPTRLKAMDATLQERLINWGYAITDAAMRRWVTPHAPPPSGFPFPAAGVGG
jgi:NTE family protein